MRLGFSTIYLLICYSCLFKVSAVHLWHLAIIKCRRDNLESINILWTVANFEKEDENRRKRLTSYAFHVSTFRVFSKEVKKFFRFQPFPEFPKIIDRIIFLCNAFSVKIKHECYSYLVLKHLTRYAMYILLQIFQCSPYFFVKLLYLIMNKLIFEGNQM